ncbi:MAG: EamA family transporter, partial [Halocynthiibacter sp.]
GAAPMIVLVAGAFLLADTVEVLEYFGVVTIGGGIVLMARGVFKNGESRRMLPWALASAVATASYSLVDGMGARIAGDATQFVAWVFAIDGAIFASVALFRKGSVAMVGTPRIWAVGSLAGAASLGAYWIVVWAMTVAPIALVTAVRETSILFAVLFGVILFGERLDKGKIMAAALIVLGVVMTRL